MLYPEVENMTVRGYMYHSIPKAKNLCRLLRTTTFEDRYKQNIQQSRDRTWKKSAGRVQKKAPAISGA